MAQVAAWIRAPPSSFSHLIAIRNLLENGICASNYFYPGVRMSLNPADRHLLFGLLALQNGLISREQFVSAFAKWTSDVHSARRNFSRRWGQDVRAESQGRPQRLRVDIVFAARR